jgi:hypothetical protein
MIIIIIISPLKSTAGYRSLQLHAVSLDLLRLASSSCQPSCANRHSTWPEGVPHYVYHDAVSTPELLYCHFSMLIRCAMLLTLVFCRILYDTLYKFHLIIVVICNNISFFSNQSFSPYLYPTKWGRYNMFFIML